MKKLLCILLTLSLTLMLASAALADDPITLRFSSWGDAAEKAILAPQFREADGAYSLAEKKTLAQAIVRAHRFPKADFAT